ncbi:hypothetical protein M011DRAFT_470419, partial [Sporormia fimetaria CBS 119925]
MAHGIPQARDGCLFRTKLFFFLHGMGGCMGERENGVLVFLYLDLYPSYDWTWFHVV